MASPPRSAPPSLRPPTRHPRRAREAGSLVLSLVIAVLAIGGGFLFASGAYRALPNVLPFAQATPVPTLAARDALHQIQAAYPAATISLSSSISDEVDLVTTTSSGSPPSSALTTHVLSLYMRGYPHQTIWRWINRNAATRATTVVESHATELWVITEDSFTCTPVWTIWTITPDEILRRGASGGDYTTGTTSRPGTGVPQGFNVPCQFSA